ncbi:MAG TPA: glycosyl transferase family 1 [Planctomycetales bacterium]|nr:glycosyl transferase family 1 [Planctomycetales bacterium]
MSPPIPEILETPLAASRTHRPLNVVIVDEELPYPPTSGKRIRTLNLTLRLARRHRITYICHRNSDPAEARQATDFFRDQGIAARTVDWSPPPKSGAAFYARLAANLLSPLPYSAVSHDSQPLRQALREHAASHPVDLWHCEWTPYVQAVRGLPKGRRLVVAHNVESVIWRRYYETEPHPLRRWYVGGQWRKFERFERQVMGEVDRAVAVSSLDAERLRRDFGARRVDVVENGVDPAYFRPQNTQREPAQLLFLGSLDWRPNLDGVRLLLDRVFPAVRATVPSARLCLVGRHPPTWLKQASAAPGVELHADLPDVRPQLARCGMMVVPLRIGGGSRLKILEALASNTPVVSTRVGAEGLELEPERHLTVVEDVEDLPGAIIRAVREPAAMASQAERGREAVLARYGWDALADQMDRVWIDCVAGQSLSV